MSREKLQTFDTKVLTDALNDGENLLDSPKHTPYDLRDTLGYEVYPIREPTGEEGRSVFLVMGSEGDSVEPVTLVGDVTLTIRVVSGMGLVVIDVPGEGVNTTLLAGYGINSVDPVTLEQGWSYAYLNIGDEPFVIRDDSFPDFVPEYEKPATSATDPDLIQKLAELGIAET